MTAVLQHTLCHGSKRRKKKHSNTQVKNVFDKMMRFVTTHTLTERPQSTIYYTQINMMNMNLNCPIISGSICCYIWRLMCVNLSLVLCFTYIITASHIPQSASNVLYEWIHISHLHSFHPNLTEWHSWCTVAMAKRCENKCFIDGWYIYKTWTTWIMIC